MFELNKRYTIGQIVELIGTDKQKEKFERENTLKGNPKKALLKELETYVEYELIKGRPQYYLITEKFEKQKEKEDRRSENKILYPKAKDLLIYNLFETNNFDEDIYFNKTQLMTMCGFARKGFEFILYNRKEYANKIGVNQKIFSSAVDTKYTYTRSKVDSALNQLKKDRIIENWKNVIYVYGANKAVPFENRAILLTNQNYELNSKDENILRNIRERIAKENGYENYFMAMRNDKNKELKQLIIKEFNKQTGLNIKNYRSKVAIIRLDKDLLKSRKTKTYNKIMNEQIKKLCKKEMEETYKELKKKGIDINDIILSEEKKEKIKNDVKTSVEYLNIVEII